MNVFRVAQRVLVRRCGLTGNFVLDPPEKGVVVRLRNGDAAAWVRLDKRRHDADHPFPITDAVRARYVVAWPQHCTVAREKKP